ncbi:hypothetical protein [Moraxella lacunata]
MCPAIKYINSDNYCHTHNTALMFSIYSSFTNPTTPILPKARPHDNHFSR